MKKRRGGANRRRTDRNVLLSGLIRCFLPFSQPTIIAWRTDTQMFTRMSRIIIPNRFAISRNADQMDHDTRGMRISANPPPPLSHPSLYLLYAEIWIIIVERRHGKAYVRELSIILKSFPFGNCAKRFLSCPPGARYSRSAYPWWTQILRIARCPISASCILPLSLTVLEWILRRDLSRTCLLRTKRLELIPLNSAFLIR